MQQDRDLDVLELHRILKEELGHTDAVTFEGYGDSMTVTLQRRGFCGIDRNC
jgi:hypothetical protein